MKFDELISHLTGAGVAPESIVRFDKIQEYRHVRYVDLLGGSKNYHEILPDAVVESSGQPFVYVVRGDRLGDVQDRTQTRLADLIRTLACRSDARYLGVVTAGTLQVYPLGIFETPPPPLTLVSQQYTSTWRALLSGATLPFDTAGQQQASGLWLETLLFQLLVDAAEGIHQAAPQLTIQQVIALVGRALFFRFLVDRGIVSENDAPSISVRVNSLADMFGSVAPLIDTCTWLDKTFNGDLLSLGNNDFESLLQIDGTEMQTMCWHLTNIQYRAVGGQLPLDWSGIKFQHVPVDVLSQVYEDFAHKFVPELARQTSVHFTPRQLAEVVIDGAFSAVQSALPHEAKVLDPAVGAGVFLVLAFRRLVAERWRVHNKRPTRREIRKILMTQLVGFDINRDALNIAALSLYLAALELDPTPSPLDDLKFQKLLGTVLHPVDVQALDISSFDAELGSLSAEVRSKFNGVFDIVVGNPPWTGFKGTAATKLNQCMAGLLENSARPQRREKDAEGLPVVARYGSPDVAFLLASTHWAKPNAALGFALHGRLLFQRDAFELRRRLFEAVRVTGIMNFAALRQDKKLWPTNDAPFALLVARNEPPLPNDNFYFISPKQEPLLAKMGQFRIDPTSATPIPVKLIKDESAAFKSVFKGGLLGLDLLSRVREKAALRTVAQQLKLLGLKFWSGYQIGEPEHQRPLTIPLCGLPMVTLDMKFCVDDRAREFGFTSLQWERKRYIYNGPLLLFRESPKADRSLRGALYSPNDAAYSESFFGLSFHGKKHLSPLMDLLYILSFSDLFLYHQLLTSTKFGVERDSSLQTDLDEFPLVDFATLSPVDKKTIAIIARQLRDRQQCWHEIDMVVAKLYDLSPADVQLIKDTLATELPFAETKKKANAPVTELDINVYIETFNRLVAPFQPSGKVKLARRIPVPFELIDGWAFIEIQSPDCISFNKTQNHDGDLTSLSEIAGVYWASQLCLQQNNGGELVGRLNQWRYWTRTQARLAAIDWVRNNSLTGGARTT